MHAYLSPRPASRLLPGPALATLLIALAGCIPARPAPSPPPVARPVPTSTPLPPAPPPSSDWRDWPLTPGTWTYARDLRGSVAKFGNAGQDAVLVLRCDLARRQLYLSRPGALRAPLTVRTTSTTRSLAVQPTGGAAAYVAATLAARDPLLDAIGFSRGRFVVEQQGTATLVVPAWAEIERVTEDCRG